MDQPKVIDLINQLRENGKTDQQIISLLSDLIQFHMMYGGDLQEQVVYRLKLR